MQVAIVFALFAAASAAGGFYSPYVPVGVSSGLSNSHRSQDNFGNYAFGYDEAHSTGGTFRKEVGDSAGNKAGSYGLTDIDGRQRIVNYVADAAGFRVDIKTNEQGVDASKDPASATINKDLVIAPATPVAAVSFPAAPVAPIAPVAPVAPVVEAPVAPIAPVVPAADATPALATALEISSPLHYSAGVVGVGNAIAAPWGHHYSTGIQHGVHHYAAAPVVAAQTVGVHHYAAAPVAKVHHYAAAPVAAGVHHYAAAPVAAGVHHYAAAPVAAGVHHYAAGAPWAGAWNGAYSYSNAVAHHGPAHSYSHQSVVKAF